MAMSNNPAQFRFPVFWRELPDPRTPAAAGNRTAVIVNRAAWEQHVLRHVIDRRQPFAGLLETATVETLRTAQAAGTTAPQVVQQALGQLETEVRRSLGRPLVILYEARDQDLAAGNGRQVWLLVLPCGATAYVHQGGEGRYGQGGFLATCYFPRAAVVEPNSERRWICVVRWLVQRYGILDPCQGLLPAHAQHVVRVNENNTVRELRSAIQFVTLATWGFRVDLAGSPWRWRPQPWVPPSVAAAGPPRGPKPRRLKPRRRIWEDDDGV